MSTSFGQCTRTRSCAVAGVREPLLVFIEEGGGEGQGRKGGRSYKSSDGEGPTWKPYEKTLH
eukprot:1787552-Prorocentrum_lima.AAC.1